MPVDFSLGRQPLRQHRVAHVAELIVALIANRQVQSAVGREGDAFGNPDTGQRPQHHGVLVLGRFLLDNLGQQREIVEIERGQRVPDVRKRIDVAARGRIVGIGDRIRA